MGETGEIEGILLQLRNARRDGETGMVYREDFGKMNSFILEILQGLRETIQYGQGKEHLACMEEMAGELSGKNPRLKAILRPVTGTCILMLLFAMLYLSMWPYGGGA